MVDRMRAACETVERCYHIFGSGLVLTSGDEAETLHRGKPVAGDTVNPHYLGKAVDFRIRHVPFDKRQGLVDMIEDELGPDFFVYWEARDTANEHLHIQLGHVVP